ncbi:MAG TPA: hypothetical protein VHY80_21090 [Stellaceae bacterium]|jgi:hypothetical protein|nr:hypothetical protein [Stellaceae bacterium]
MPDDHNVIHLQSLTRADITALERLADAMIASGSWLSAERARDDQCDHLKVATRDVCGVAFSLGVLASGRYFYMDHRSSAVLLGEDLAEILEQAGLSAEDWCRG